MWLCTQRKEEEEKETCFHAACVLSLFFSPGGILLVDVEQKKSHWRRLNLAIFHFNPCFASAFCVHTLLQIRRIPAEKNALNYHLISQFIIFCKNISGSSHICLFFVYLPLEDILTRRLKGGDTIACDSTFTKKGLCTKAQIFRDFFFFCFFPNSSKSSALLPTNSSPSHLCPLGNRRHYCSLSGLFLERRRHVTELLYPNSSLQ